MTQEQHIKPAKPEGLETPGLVYRSRKTGWLLMWLPRSDLVARGYPGKSRRFWPTSQTPPQQLEPTLEEWESIAAWCCKYQGEMLVWSEGGMPRDPASVFDGTVKSLSQLYQIDPDSDFANLRYKVRQMYANRLKVIEADHGSVKVAGITFRDIKRWYDAWAAPAKPGGPRRAPRAYALITQLKLIISYGKKALKRSSGCADLIDILSEMEFSGGQRRRKLYLTYQQAALVCVEAHRLGWHSLALTQAFMIECGVRQKDMIGEWVPRKEPGVTDVFAGPRKWLMGARWEEIDEHFVWKHRLSKSVKGLDAIMDAEAGQTEEFDLLAFPLVRAEFERIAPLDRANFPASGPVIVYERTGRPWATAVFRKRWRDCAKAGGLPGEVQNRDSRPGAATEAELAGAAPDTVRRLLGHARGETTEIYRRGNREVRSQIAEMRSRTRGEQK